MNQGQVYPFFTQPPLDIYPSNWAAPTRAGFPPSTDNPVNLTWGSDVLELYKQKRGTNQKDIARYTGNWCVQDTVWVRRPVERKSCPLATPCPGLAITPALSLLSTLALTLLSLPAWSLQDVDQQHSVCHPRPLCRTPLHSMVVHLISPASVHSSSFCVFVPCPDSLRHHDPPPSNCSYNDSVVASPWQNALMACSTSFLCLMGFHPSVTAGRIFTRDTWACGNATCFEARLRAAFAVLPANTVLTPAVLENTLKNYWLTPDQVSTYSAYKGYTLQTAYAQCPPNQVRHIRSCAPRQVRTVPSNGVYAVHISAAPRPACVTLNCLSGSCCRLCISSCLSCTLARALLTLYPGRYVRAHTPSAPLSL